MSLHFCLGTGGGGGEGPTRRPAPFSCSNPFPRCRTPCRVAPQPAIQAFRALRTRTETPLHFVDDDTLAQLLLAIR